MTTMNIMIFNDGIATSISHSILYDCPVSVKLRIILNRHFRIYHAVVASVIKVGNRMPL